MVVDLHLGDCLTGLPLLDDRSCEHAIFDPPFSERVHARLGREGRKDGTPSRKALTFEHMTRDEAQAIARHLCRICTRWIIVICDEITFGFWIEAIEAAGGEYVRKGTWVKVDPMPQMSGDRPATGTEEIVIAHAPRPSRTRMRWNGCGKAAVYQVNPQERGIEREHPNQKPLALMDALVRDFTDAGDAVLDPYAGTASTGVACKRLGRSFIGFERDPKYHAIGARRLAETCEQPDLISREAHARAARVKRPQLGLSLTPEPS